VTGGPRGTTLCLPLSLTPRVQCFLSPLPRHCGRRHPGAGRISVKVDLSEPSPDRCVGRNSVRPWIRARIWPFAFAAETRIRRVFKRRPSSAALSSRRTLDPTLARNYPYDESANSIQNDMRATAVTPDVTLSASTDHGKGRLSLGAGEGIRVLDRDLGKGSCSCKILAAKHKQQNQIRKRRRAANPRGCIGPKLTTMRRVPLSSSH
jgi:hypothetical protein